MQLYLFDTIPVFNAFFFSRKINMWKILEISHAHNACIVFASWTYKCSGPYEYVNRTHMVITIHVKVYTRLVNDERTMHILTFTNTFKLLQQKKIVLWAKNRLFTKILSPRNILSEFWCRFFLSHLMSIAGTSILSTVSSLHETIGRHRQFFPGICIKFSLISSNFNHIH